MFVYDIDLILTFLGSKHEHQTVLNTVIGTSLDREMTLAFNYASQALNNSFFLDHLVCTIV